MDATALKLLRHADTEDMDNERMEMLEADVAGLHRFFSKHLEIPGHKDLVTLFSQVPRTHLNNLISLTKVMFVTCFTR